MIYDYVKIIRPTKKDIWLNRFNIKMKLKLKIANLCYNSWSAFYFVTNQVIDNKIKHIDIMYQFIKNAFFW